MSDLIDLILAYIAALVSVAGAAAFWASQAALSGSPIWPLPALALIDWALLGSSGGLVAFLVWGRVSSCMLSLLWGITGALAPLVYLGAFSIGPFVLVSLVLFLASTIILTRRAHYRFLPALGVFLLGGIINLALLYVVITLG